jgi:glycine/D-amino acid oxidase-like deaminating enzyme
MNVPSQNRPGSECDVVVLGGGPAGAAAAITLARAGRSVVVIEKSQYEQARIGETLPPAARLSLAGLKVWEPFLAAGHLPSPGVLSVWGEYELYETHFIFNADFRRAKMINIFGSSREAHGYWKITGRFRNQGIAWRGWSRAASRRIGLWQRLSKCTTIRSGWISTTPPVSTNLRYSCLGAAVSKPRNCLASQR